MPSIYRLFAPAVIVLLAGCVTPTGPARYYALSLPPLQAEPAAGGVKAIPGRLLIGPVEVADHLDRTQLVTRSGANRLQFNELDQWAGSLAGQVEQVLLYHLANRLGRDAVLPYPAEADRPGDRRLRIRVLELSADTGGRARLSLFWQASGGEQTDRYGLESFEQGVAGEDLDTVVAAYDALLAQAAERIAVRLRRGD